MKRLFAIVGLGLSLSGCAAVDPYGDYGYGYGRPGGPYDRGKRCYEVRDYYGTPYVECRYVKRWRPEQQYSERRYYSDRDRDYSDRRYPERRYKEYYD